MNRIIATLTLLIAALTAAAASTPEVSLVTVFPGTDIYELDGHLVIRINYDDGRDAAVSYGEFDFDAPNFVYRFVKGETDYHVAMMPWGLLQDAYARAGRRMVQHTVDMDSAQTARLLQLIDVNLRPENRVYRYNYVKDNCATRPLRMIELAMGDTILLPPAAIEANSSVPVTFRNVMRENHRNYPWYQFGIDLALGSGIDYPLSHREEAFTPLTMDTQLGGALCGGQPLIRSTRVPVDVPADEAMASPTPWLLTPMAVCWLFFIVTAAVCARDIRRRRVTRWLESAYFGIAGLAGLLLTFLIFVSVHEATSPNWLYLWLNPLCLVPAIFIWLKKCNKLVYSYHFANFAVLFTGLLLWPWIPQSANPAFLPLVLSDMALSATYIYVNRKKQRENR